MTKFNTKATGTKTENLAGGEAFAQSNELELVSILLTSFGEDSHYRNAGDTFKRLKELITVCDQKFVAQAIVYARTKFGMRSVTHVAASELAKHLTGMEWAKAFFNAVIYRVDDMTEILAYHLSKNGKVPNSMKKGFANAFDKFDAYSLAKYRGEGNAVKLVDVVNMVHPVPVEKNASAIRDLVKGELRSFDTWETELTKAGQDAKNETDKIALKKAAWKNLISENKIGYFALLRNIRNIIEQAPEMLDEVSNQLLNEWSIKKSLVLPFRFLSAFEAIRTMPNGDSTLVRKMLGVLNKAVDLSMSNVPKFEGSTLIVLDSSGSMHMSHLGIKSPHVIGALFSSVLYKANEGADFMVFSDDAKYVNLNPGDSVITMTDSMRFAQGRTNFHSIFARANKKYDRVIILSDMQGWVGHHTPVATFDQYKKKFDAKPYIYSFDLQNYGTMMFPEKNVFCMAGFSEKVFDIMTYMEKDKKVLFNEIKKIEL